MWYKTCDGITDWTIVIERTSLLSFIRQDFMELMNVIPLRVRLIAG